MSGPTAVDTNGTVTSAAYLSAGSSSWATVSDRNAKKNFEPVNTQGVLEKLAALPLEQWNYKWEADDATPNIGPMAQDFKAAFYPGRDDKSITTLEFDGVELAALQGLNKKVDDEGRELGARSRQSEDRIQKLEAENAQLKQQNDSLAKRLTALEELIGGRSARAGR